MYRNHSGPCGRQRSVFVWYGLDKPFVEASTNGVLTPLKGRVLSSPFRKPCDGECSLAAVDVIVPCYGYGRFLRECVESVLVQPLATLRVLIIDDASPDDTAEVARRLLRADSRVSLIRHPVNLGHIATYNEGLNWASATYLLVLSADDFLLPGALGRAIALMEAHPEVGFTYGGCIPLHPGAPRPPGEGESQSGHWRVLTSAEFIERNGARNDVATATVAVRTSLQHRVGGYRADLPHTADMEMWLRLALHGPVGLVEANQAVYRRHDTNMSLRFNGRLEDLRQRKAAVDAAFGTLEPPNSDLGDLRAKLARELARDAVAQASEAFNRGDTAECERILDFAIRTCADAPSFVQWRRVAWKRRLGPKLWAAVHPMLHELRRMGVAR